MELQRLKYFYQVALTGSVSEAARAMRVSAPAVSKMVALLEREIGTPLFIRSGRRLHLNSDGERLRAECREIFDRIERFNGSLKEKNGVISGELRLGASDNLCHYRLPALLADFSRRHTQVSISLFAGTSGDIVQRIKSGALDIGLFYTHTHDRGIQLTTWDNAHFVMVCSTEHPLAKVKKVSPATLASYRFVGSRARDYPGTYPALTLLKSFGIKAKSEIESNSQEAQKKLVMAGLGYSILPAHMVTEELESGRLVTLLKQTVLNHPIYVAIGAERKTPSRNSVKQTFLRYLFEKRLSAESILSKIREPE